MQFAGKFADLREEAQEGVLGGLMAGAGMLGTDTPLPQVAIQTLGAMALGTGIGMLGKTIGARVGKAIHPQALKNQEGQLANFGRVAGQKTLQSGVAETVRMAKGQIKQELKNQTTASLMNEALQNPVAFAGKYGVEAETFKKYHSMVNQAGQGRAALETLENLTPEMRSQVAAKANQMMNQGFNQVEDLINTQAASQLDRNLTQMAEKARGKKIPGINQDIAEVYEALLKEPKGITGEHIGRAIGRFVGDEIGVVTGIGVGGMISNAMGIKNEKDKKIEELKAQLASGY